MSTDVFLSYIGRDRDLTALLAADFERSGLDVWWDAKLRPGDDFGKRIQEVVSDAKVIVGVLSPDALRSDWVRWEIAQAHANGLFVVPVLIQGARSEDLPPPLSLIHAIELPAEVSAVALEACARKVGEFVIAVNRRQRIPQSGVREMAAARRLAQSAVTTARRAAEIQRNNRSTTRRRDSIESSQQLPVGYSASDGFARFLGDNRLGLAMTSPDAGLLLMLGCDPEGRLSITEERFDGATGLFVEGESLMLAGRHSLYRLENLLRGRQVFDGIYTHCYLPRTAHFVGEVDPHDLAWSAEDGLIFVSSRYSCLAAVCDAHSFRLVWRPEFISEILAEDRCHLNGLAMQEGRPTFVTACAASDELDGWRAAMSGGGIVVDVRDDRIVCDGLSMPHSPRMHQGKLWVLNSGLGELGTIDVSGSMESSYRSVAFCGGFTRGLAFHDNFAFVGVSRPRHNSFKGLDLDGRLTDAEARPWTGVALIDIQSGFCTEWFRIDGQAREIHGVAALPGVRCPTSVSTARDEACGLITME